MDIASVGFEFVEIAQVPNRAKERNDVAPTVLLGGVRFSTKSY